MKGLGPVGFEAAPPNALLIPKVRLTLNRGLFKSFMSSSCTGAGMARLKQGSTNVRDGTREQISLFREVLRYKRR